MLCARRLLVLFSRDVLGCCSLLNLPPFVLYLPPTVVTTAAILTTDRHFNYSPVTNLLFLGRPSFEKVLSLLVCLLQLHIHTKCSVFIDGSWVTTSLPKYPEPGSVSSQIRLDRVLNNILKVHWYHNSLRPTSDRAHTIPTIIAKAAECSIRNDDKKKW